MTFGELLTLLEADYVRKERAALTDTMRGINKHLVPAFGETRVLDLRRRDVEAFIDIQRKAGAKPGSINKLLANLRRSMQLGMDSDPQIVLRIPRWFTKLDGENVRTGVVTEQMYRELIPAFIADHARLACVIGYHTGLRRGAILSLKWEWVDWRERVISVALPKRETNKNKPKTVPIYGEMRSYLEMAYAGWTSMEAAARTLSKKTAGISTRGSNECDWSDSKKWGAIAER